MNLGLTVALFFTPIVAASFLLAHSTEPVCRSDWNSRRRILSLSRAGRPCRHQESAHLANNRMAKHAIEHLLDTQRAAGTDLHRIFYDAFHTYGMITWLPEYLAIRN